MSHIIAVGVDGSDSSKAAVAWAIENCSENATIKLVSAITEKITEEIAHQNFDAVLPTDLPAGVQIERLTVNAEPVDALLTAAEGADLLVLGRHGTSGLIHSAIGSVGDAMARLAPCPVVIVPKPRPV